MASNPRALAMSTMVLLPESARNGKLASRMSKVNPWHFARLARSHEADQRFLVKSLGTALGLRVLAFSASGIGAVGEVPFSRSPRIYLGRAGATRKLVIRPLAFPCCTCSGLGGSPVVLP